MKKFLAVLVVGFVSTHAFAEEPHKEISARIFMTFNMHALCSYDLLKDDAKKADYIQCIDGLKDVESVLTKLKAEENGDTIEYINSIILTLPTDSQVHHASNEVTAEGNLYLRVGTTQEEIEFTILNLSNDYRKVRRYFKAIGFKNIEGIQCNEDEVTFVQCVNAISGLKALLKKEPRLKQELDARADILIFGEKFKTAHSKDSTLVNLRVVSTLKELKIQLEKAMKELR